VSGNAQDLEPSRFLPRPVEVSEQKIRNYLLDVDHRDSGPKARFFLAQGFSDAAWQDFANALRRHPIDNPIQDREPTDYGMNVMVECTLRTPDGGNPCVRTVWMRDGTQNPRLVTAYPWKG
jgi:hypothetical protein